MSKKVGLDLGTTYSIASYYNEKEQKISAIDFGTEEDDGTGYRPINAINSMVLFESDGTIHIGKDAAEYLEDDDIESFLGFKMLLNEVEETYKARGYSREYTPKKICSDYIKEVFNVAQGKKKGGDSFKNVKKIVYGVPLVWNSEQNEVKKRILRDIIMEATGVKEVESFSEPALACAYIVYNINQRMTKEGNGENCSYSGHILVVDYGGGTLDITLCKVKENEVSIIRSWGAGENTDNTMGSAGLAYMEAVADMILKENELNFNKGDKKYKCFVCSIEDEIKRLKSKISEAVGNEAYCSETGNFYNKKVNTAKAIYYNGKQCQIKYKHIFEAYNETIAPILEKKLKEAIAYMDKEKVDYKKTDGSFKIATIGGFCNFPLTYGQIIETRGLRKKGKYDGRYLDIDLKDTEMAVAYGATVNANGLVKIKHQFPYSFNCYGSKLSKDKYKKKTCYDVTNKYKIWREGDEYTPNKPFFLVSENEDNQIFMTQGSTIPYLQAYYSNRSVNRILEPKMNLKVKRSDNESNSLVCVAFSMDENQVLTMHSYEMYDEAMNVNPLTEDYIKNHYKSYDYEELAKLDQLFGEIY